MVVYYVYILEVIAKNGKKNYYTGYTNDLYRRWQEHRSGTGARFCRGKKHIELKYFETYLTRQKAMRRELQIKSFSKQQKLDLIKSLSNKIN
ncbi:MAG: GIY-YIG nuclease family protein [Candidatus Hermodarchaeota archaeon]